MFGHFALKRLIVIIFSRFIFFLLTSCCIKHVKYNINIHNNLLILKMFLGLHDSDIDNNFTHLVAGVSGQTEERHHVVKRMTKSCDSTFDDYCLNNGQCMLLVDINEHHCKCVGGYSGPRCGTVRLNDFVFQPLAEEQVVVVVFCVSLLIIGLAGALYFCCKWYKKNRFPRQQKRHSYKGVQAV
uniref:EGF-like domain-containing protein n=1 Tax=Amphiprion ocellaris TaxID=80972 RepID=A0AAQ5Z788_AMPOC